MRTRLVIFTSIVIVCLFIGSDISIALSHPEMSSKSDIDAKDYITSPEQLFNEIADFVPPRSPVSLANLVTELQAATPIANRTDVDADGLYDPVEIVIGTDFNNTDSDFDTLDDAYEVYNDLDPLNADSNDDGVTDNYEVLDVLSLDLDSDNVSNAWDFDNDGDGVNDNVDISPNAKSAVHESFDLNITTDGNPLYMTFQVVPENPDHLNLINQWWDWPHDEHDRMQDLDDSQEDVKIVPLLKLTTNLTPDASEIQGYPVYLTESGMTIELTPVYSYGSIVAFEGRIYLPASLQTSVSLHAELEWHVQGFTDFEAVTLNVTDDLILASGPDNIAIANTNEIATNPTLHAMKIEQIGNGKIAIRNNEGLFLSVSDSEVLYFNGTEIIDRTSFYGYAITETGEREYRDFSPTDTLYLTSAFNFKTVSNNTEGVLIANSVEATGLKISQDDVYNQLERLVIYLEAFSFTGIMIEESYGCDLGLVYSANKNQTIAAAVDMTYEFLRNHTTTIADLPTVLSSRGVSVSLLQAAFQGRDHALMSMSNGMMTSVLNALPDGLVAPVIAATEYDMKLYDLSQVNLASHICGQTMDIDLTQENRTVVRSQQMHWYNTSTYLSLSPAQITDEILSWGLGEEDTAAIVCMMIKLLIGENIISSVNGNPRPTVIPEISLLTSTENVAKGFFATFGEDIIKVTLKSGWKLFASLRSLYWLYKGVYSVKIAEKTAEATRAASTASKAATTSGKFSAFYNNVGFGLGIFFMALDIGLSIATAIQIQNEIGGRVGQEIGFIYAAVSILYTLTVGITLLLINPYAALAISIALLIAEIYGSWSSKIIEFVTGIVFGSPETLAYTYPSTTIQGTPKVAIDDVDNNGMSVGDLISFTVTFIADIVGRWGGTRYLVDDSVNYPFLDVQAPSGSFSLVDLLGGLLDTQLFEWESGVVRHSRYNQSTTIQANLAMPNFPISLNVMSNYRVYNKWKHEYLGPIGIGWFSTTYTDEIVDSSSYEYTTMYFDVMPGTLEEFLVWKSITPVDNDLDGLNNTAEVSGRTDPWRYDSDGDSLNDKFELDIGTDPRDYDSDGDSLSDFYEVVYGTDPSSVDSDNDGLYDYIEVAGWQIGFNYTGNSSLSFETLVTSDPNSADSDNDGVDDLDEYYSTTNPRSVDTNGDGIWDRNIPRINTTVTLVAAADVATGEYFAHDIAVNNDDGSIWVSSQYEDGTYWGYIRRHYNNATAYNDYGLSRSGATPLRMSGGLPDSVHCILWTASSLKVTKFDNDGEYVHDLDIPAWDIDFTSDERLFALNTNSPIITEYVTDYVNETSWGTSGSGLEQFGNPRRLSIDEKYSQVYVACGMDDPSRRVVRWNIDSESYQGELPGLRHYIYDVAVDSEGYVYIIDKSGWGGSNYTGLVRKYDPNGVEDIEFRIETNISFNPRAIEVDSDFNIFLLNKNETRTEGVDEFQLLKLTQTVEKFDPELTDDNPDWDDDGLSNSEELAGWEITVEYNSTYSRTFNVSSDPRVFDSDADGLSDYLEYNLSSNPNCPDTDLDGLSDHEEWWRATHSGEYIPPVVSPFCSPSFGFQTSSLAPGDLSLINWDSDGDSLGDGNEISFGSDPTQSDSDMDTLSDLQEFLLNSNPNSNDSDNDGALDSVEYAGNSSLLHADSDGDFSFDGAEYENGTSPIDSDFDNDGLPDGYEIMFNTDAFNADTDGDGALDGLEIGLWLNPHNNDSDGDGLLDGAELEWGSNPWSKDSDYDGIPDNEDPDTFITWLGPVVLAYDLDANNSVVRFAEELAIYTEVIFVSVEELLANYTDYQHVVLVARPDPVSETVAGLTYDILEDTGSVIEEFMEPDSHEIAVRHGYWTETQTVAILSEAYSSDVFPVIQALRGRNVTILPDSAVICYSAEIQGINASYLPYFTINEIDILKATDCVVTLVLSDAATPEVELQRYDESSTPQALTAENGLFEGEYSMEKYLELSLTIPDAGVTLDSAYIYLYYKHSDLDRDDNGLFTDPDDINESTLVMYYYDEVTMSWMRLSENLEWVIAMGVNTTDVELYGTSYAGYVWAHVKHTSLYGIGGKLNSWVTPFPYVLVIVISTGAVVMIIGVAFFKRRRKSSG